ncbi:hypothetical protein [Thalassospira xiamenensis]|uniref:Uncharacterized protein n=1 Tax=Thalassospira xiamenensis TaxID=220697 RepID=A0A285U228_9PROT|nr:hypothetical protein [Thalassospira xiamenensis]SOC30347.1 hypothetical protein SAMN05428964_10914 [Thalassospira xiamenensis]
MFYRAGNKSVERALSRFRDASEQYAPTRLNVKSSSNVDRIVLASVNVPFPQIISIPTIVGTFQSGIVEKHWHGHLQRFLEELPDRIKKEFYWKHDITQQQISHVEKLLRPDSRATNEIGGPHHDTVSHSRRTP